MTALRKESLRDLLRPSQDAAIAEMVREARRHIPEYVEGSEADHALQHRVATTVALFVDSLGQDEPDWLPLTDLYARIGEDTARAGDSLDRLQTALRLSSQVACRRFIKDAYRFGWPQETDPSEEGATRGGDILSVGRSWSQLVRGDAVAVVGVLLAGEEFAGLLVTGMGPDTPRVPDARSHGGDGGRETA